MSDENVLRDRAARLAKPLALARRDGASAIVVVIGEQRYAFAVGDVRRAAVLSVVTPLPHVPSLVLGLGVIDADVLAVFDGRVWAGGARRAHTERIPVLVLGPPAAPLALAVDAFAGSTTIAASLARTASAPAWLKGLTDDGVLVVDVAALLEDPMFASGNRPIEGAVDDHHKED